MASTILPHPLSLKVSSRTSGASDLLRSSNNGIIGVGVQLKVLGLGLGRGSSRLGSEMSKRNFTVSALFRKKGEGLFRKRKKLEVDPNPGENVLEKINPFKPLKEKPKPVILDFEKPLVDLEKKIIEIKKMAAETGLDFTDQITLLQNKYDKALKDLYTHLTPIQRVNIARHPNRPTFLDHVLNITDKWIELHGDRAGYDDPAIVTGLGRINDRTYMFIGHQKGRNTKENIKRNFGMPTPHGYRKALRMMNYADHHGFPIITFIDTPGAFADLKSEELGQGEAIAFNLRAMFSLKVPIVSVVIGEGGSGGALAIGCANRLIMLENAVFFVASPEACAAILWKSAKAAPKAAEKLKITATELSKLKICDRIIPEPLGGAHVDPAWTSQQIKSVVLEEMDVLLRMDIPDLLEHRRLKFRNIGGFEEGIQEGTKVIVNKKQKKDSKKEMEEKLANDVIEEFEKICESLGMKERQRKLKKQLKKAEALGKLDSSGKFLDPILLEFAEKFQQDLAVRMPESPHYPSYKYKCEKLEKFYKQNQKVTTLKQKSNKEPKKKVNVGKKSNEEPKMKVNMEQKEKPIVQPAMDNSEGDGSVMKDDADGELAQAVEYSGGDGSVLKEDAGGDGSVLKEDVEREIAQAMEYAGGDESVLKEDAEGEIAQAMEYAGGDESVLKEDAEGEIAQAMEDSGGDGSVLKEDEQHDESSVGINIGSAHS